MSQGCVPALHPRMYDTVEDVEECQRVWDEVSLLKFELRKVVKAEGMIPYSAK